MLTKNLIVPLSKFGIRKAIAGYQHSLPTFGRQNEVFSIAAGYQRLVSTETIISVVKTMYRLVSAAEIVDSRYLMSVLAAAIGSFGLSDVV